MNVNYVSLNKNVNKANVNVMNVKLDRSVKEYASVNVIVKNVNVNLKNNVNPKPNFT